METESAYLTLIGEVEGYSFSKNILTFKDGDGETLLQYVKIS